MIEIVSPVQKAGYVVFEQLKAYAARAAGGHCEKSVAHAAALSAAIISPQIRHFFVDKGLNVVDGGDRTVDDALFIEFDVGEGVHYGIAVK